MAEENPIETVQEPTKTRILLLVVRSGSEENGLDTSYRVSLHAILLGEEERYVVEYESGVEINDLPDVIQNHTPDIVHLIIPSDISLPSHLPEDHPLNSLNPTLTCIILDRCCSQKQASDISQTGPAVIRIPDPTSDDEALSFFEEFYRAISTGIDVEQAFKAVGELPGDKEAEFFGPGGTNRLFEKTIYWIRKFPFPIVVKKKAITRGKVMEWISKPKNAFITLGG